VAYPDAGEALAYREVGDVSREDHQLRTDVSPAVRAALDQGNRERSIRRIRTTSRRYAVASKCDQVVTLTFRPGSLPCAESGDDRPVYSCRDFRRAVRAEWDRTARRLRAVYGAVPFLVVLEPHADGHIHVHIVVPRRFVVRERTTRLIAGLWGLGWVDGDGDGFKRRPGESSRERCRRACRYAVKYAVKGVEGGQLEPGEHSYEVGEGFQPVAVRAVAWDAAGAFGVGIGIMGGEVPAYTFDSGSDPDWRGPPLLYWGFA